MITVSSVGSPAGTITHTVRGGVELRDELLERGGADRALTLGALTASALKSNATTS